MSDRAQALAVRFVAEMAEQRFSVGEVEHVLSAIDVIVKEASYAAEAFRLHMDVALSHRLHALQFQDALRIRSVDQGDERLKEVSDLLLGALLQSGSPAPGQEG